MLWDWRPGTRETTSYIPSQQIIRENNKKITRPAKGVPQHSPQARKKNAKTSPSKNTQKHSPQSNLACGAKRCKASSAARSCSRASRSKLQPVSIESTASGGSIHRPNSADFWFSFDVGEKINTKLIGWPCSAFLVRLHQVDRGLCGRS